MKNKPSTAIGRRPDGRQDSYQRRACSGFTLLELSFVLAGVALLLISALPLLGNSKLRSDRLVCGNNLRRIGVAFQTWADSHQDRVPWQVPPSSNPGEGGTGYGNPLINLAWYHFWAVSNELATPTLLGCPSDNVKLATTWDFGPGGFLNPGYRNNALSYLVGCHAEIKLPNSVLSADRNVVPDATGQSCSLGFQFVSGVFTRSVSSAGWLSATVHLGAGNVLFRGGNVAELSTPALRKALADRQTDNGLDHWLLPR